MKEFKFSAKVTISVYTIVEAETLEEANQIASSRLNMSIIANGGDSEYDSWMCDELDGNVYDIEED